MAPSTRPPSDGPSRLREGEWVAAAEGVQGATIDLDPGAIGRVRKSVSLAQHTTRTHYPGRHRVEALVNGAPMGSAWFTVT